MNKRQKEALQSQLEAEKAVLKQLEQHYKRALNDINLKIKILQSDELTISRIYRIDHQKALKAQVEAILEKLHSDEYTTIQQFLTNAYTDAFVGTAYDLFGQGVPLILPIDPKEAVRAIQTDSKLSTDLYSALGVDTGKLKKTISAEISRGLASDMAYSDIARNIAAVSKAPLSRAKTIVATEAHRIQEASTYDVHQKAKAKGANIVRQWNSILDGDTRRNHRRLDGQIREVGEPFEIDGMKAMYPGDFGDPAEDCNCRCTVLQRAKWALDESELETLKQRAEFFGLDKTKDLEDFKKKYLKAVENTGKSGIIEAGAVRGAYNNSNDPDGSKRDTHAEKYYSSLRNSKKSAIVDAIANNAGISADAVSKMYDHLIVNEYDLDGGHTHFDPDYEIAQSIQRLRDGKNVQAHDLLLVQHEALEHDLMNNDGLGYEEAHEKANEQFNYAAALFAFLNGGE